MRLSVVLGALAVAFLAVAPAMAGLPVEVKNYSVQFTNNPPNIDGVISPGEWDAAVDANPDGTGDWRLLRDASASVDFENNQFQMLWDEDFLYFQTTSEYGFWDAPSGGDGIAFGRDNMNLYFDPNLDGEENFPPENGQLAPFNGVDGYQIAYNQYDGEYECSACTGDGTNQGQVGAGWGFFTEAHLDTLFGNQAGWVGLTDTVGAAIHNSSGGVSELAIPWTDLNADGGDGTLDITLGGTDPGTPVNGDEWFFNVARISSDIGNQLPSYNWTGSQFFASHPHAVMTFEGRGGFTADFDKDGDVDGDDFLIWQGNFGTSEGATSNTGDTDGDGDVDGDDFLGWQSQFGQGVEAGGGSSAIPEPTTALLALFSGLFLLRRNR